MRAQVPRVRRAPRPVASTRKSQRRRGPRARDEPGVSVSARVERDAAARVRRRRPRLEQRGVEARRSSCQPGRRGFGRSRWPRAGRSQPRCRALHDVHQVEFARMRAPPAAATRRRADRARRIRHGHLRRRGEHTGAPPPATAGDQDLSSAREPSSRGRPRSPPPSPNRRAHRTLMRVSSPARPRDLAHASRGRRWAARACDADQRGSSRSSSTPGAARPPPGRRSA